MGIGLVRFEKWEDAKRCVEEYHGAGVINESNDKVSFLNYQRLDIYLLN